MWFVEIWWASSALLTHASLPRWWDRQWLCVGSGNPPLTSLASRPTHFHTSILHPLSSITLYVCVYAGLPHVCLQQCFTKKSKKAQSTSMFSCVIYLCICGSKHPTFVYCITGFVVGCSQVLLTCSQLLCSFFFFFLLDVTFPISLMIDVSTFTSFDAKPLWTAYVVN